jgi:hypothetical protein
VAIEGFDDSTASLILGNGFHFTINLAENIAAKGIHGSTIASATPMILPYLAILGLEKFRRSPS